VAVVVFAVAVVVLAAAVTEEVMTRGGGRGRDDMLGDSAAMSVAVSVGSKGSVGSVRALPSPMGIVLIEEIFDEVSENVVAVSVSVSVSDSGGDAALGFFSSSSPSITTTPSTSFLDASDLTGWSSGFGANVRGGSSVAMILPGPGIPWSGSMTMAGALVLLQTFFFFFFSPLLLLLLLLLLSVSLSPPLSESRLSLLLVLLCPKFSLLALLLKCNIPSMVCRRTWGTLTWGKCGCGTCT